MYGFLFLFLSHRPTGPAKENGSFFFYIFFSFVFSRVLPFHYFTAGGMYVRATASYVGTATRVLQSSSITAPRIYHRLFLLQYPHNTHYD